MTKNRKGLDAPTSVNLSEQEMLLGITKLKRRLADLENFDPATAANTHDNDNSLAYSIADKINQTLVDIFGHKSVEYNRYEVFSLYRSGPISFAFSHGPTKREIIDNYTAGKNKAITKVNDAISLLEERLQDISYVHAQTGAFTLEQKKLSKDIFIVHGHDEAVRESVARFVSQMGLNPIILHEKPNRGRTIIEKFEENHNVGFAIILLTPDDLGKAKNTEALSPRARQNVILELGYFYGRLGRDRVIALKKGDLELPSDFVGIVWTPVEDVTSDDWKLKIAKELKSAGYDIDLNKVLS